MRWTTAEPTDTRSKPTPATTSTYGDSSWFVWKARVRDTVDRTGFFSMDSKFGCGCPIGGNTSRVQGCCRTIVNRSRLSTRVEVDPPARTPQPMPFSLHNSRRRGNSTLRLVDKWNKIWRETNHVKSACWHQVCEPRQLT